MYINCHTYFSLRYGTLDPEELVAAGAEAKVECMALTDINNTSCAFDFIEACNENNIKPVLGIEFRTDAYHPLYIGIARNNNGFMELNRFLSQHSGDKNTLPCRAPVFQDSWIIYHTGAINPDKLRENEFIGIQVSDIPKLYTSDLREYPHKLVALTTITFLNKYGYQTHNLLRAIDQNTLLTRIDNRSVAPTSSICLHRDELLKKYEAYPFLMENTMRLLDSCSINMDLDDKEKSRNKKCFTKTKAEDLELLSRLAREGCQERYGNNPQAFERLEKELDIIANLDFQAYFLITWDIIHYAFSKGYYHMGRGSGANSIVAYCLKITDVDPMELNLYFERFINPQRTSPPDFDIDFSWRDRDDVISHIIKKYNSEHVALLATYATFRGASIIRELGKVYGIPKADIDRIAEEPQNAQKHHALAQKLFEHGKRIERFPNHLGIHAGGIVITEQPIFQYTAVQTMSKGFPVTHFDMHVAEENGFFKYDVLSQRGLGHIRDAVQFIKTNRNTEVDIHQVENFKKDERIKEQLRSSRTIGCFYIESPAMRGLLSKLKCDNYTSLVAASSIIRPGVAKSGMMREYITRFHNPDSIQYLHPKFRELLQETFGVMVYQEDVIKIAHYFAGLTLSEADVLRRIMSGKSRGKKEFDKIIEKFFTNCKKFGYSEELTKEVWRQIESFSGFSFCKAHSASYAIESYQSLFLKTYYPLEFMTAVINNFGGFYDTELYVHEARMHGAVIEGPCVNHSEYLSNIKGKTIHLGFIHLKDLQENLAMEIVKERQRNGPYRNLEDFVVRTGIAREQLVLLIRIGALRFTGKSKQELLWEKNHYLKPKKDRIIHPVLIHEPVQVYALPPLESAAQEDVYEQIDLLGFPLVSPFDLLETDFRGDVMTRELKEYAGKKIQMVGYYVARKNVTTSNNKLMNFGTWIDYEGLFFDTTHFPQSLEAHPFRGKGCYLITGKVTLDFGFPSLEVEKMEKLGIKEIF